MKFTLSWLEQYVDLDTGADDLAARLTMAGLEVDSVEETGLGLDQVVIARVIEVGNHPDADRLHVCLVDDGAGTHQIVCGAANVHAGMITVMARPGAVLPGGIKIKASKLRGVDSAGMLCSATELGLDETSKGILDLDAKLNVGDPVAEALGLADTLIEVDLTPNRSDCASVVGIAREVAAFSGSDLRLPKVEPLSFGRGEGFKVSIADYDLCPRYCGCLVRGLKVAPSPWWLKKRLLSVGLRPINNVVDITNFIMLELGQPMHAFDFRRLAGGRVEARPARSDEKIVTLDGQEHQLERDMLVIADGEGPVAVAGVMGGAESQVDESTVDILLESACFSAVSVRRTARRLNLATDSSYRFERGVDPSITDYALIRAAALVVEVCGGEVIGAVDEKQSAAEPLKLSFRPGRCNKLLGIDLDSATQARMLASIGLESRAVSDGQLEVTVPTFRVDIEREIDLVEEIARLFGYDRLPEKLPRVALSPAESSPERNFRLKAASVMADIGFSEVINYSFVSPRHREMLGLGGEPAAGFVRLKNPLAEEQSVMRTSLLPGLLVNLNHNLNRQSAGMMIFEVGKVFSSRGEDVQPLENTRIGAILSGWRYAGAPVIHYGRERVDSYDVSGAVAAFMVQMGYKLDAPSVGEPLSYAMGSPIEIKVAGEMVGSFMEIDGKILQGFGIKQPAWFIDLDLEALMGINSSGRSFSPLPKFPAVFRDIAIVLDEETAYADLAACLEAAGGKLLESTELFDIYRGDKIDSGKKSVAVRLVFRSPNATLKEKQINKAMNKILAQIDSNLGGKLREN